MADNIQVFAFSPAWGLPSSGPFALKLIAWLRLAGLPFELLHEDDTRKGPKGKNPWVVLDGEPVGDSQLIIERLSREHGVTLDDWLDPLTAARAHATRRMVEEHLHQAFEYELIVHDVGFEHFREMVKGALPPIVGSVLPHVLRSQFRKQLHARGLTRHGQADIEALGRADVDALSAILGDGPWFFGERPSTADCAIWGQLAPLTLAPLDTPICQYARRQANLLRWVERVRDEVAPPTDAARAA